MAEKYLLWDKIDQCLTSILVRMLQRNRMIRMEISRSFFFYCEELAPMTMEAEKSQACWRPRESVVQFQFQSEGRKERVSQLKAVRQGEYFFLSSRMFSFSALCRTYTVWISLPHAREHYLLHSVYQMLHLCGMDQKKGSALEEKWSRFSGGA